MLKMILKWFMPSTQELSKQIAQVLAEAINNQSKATEILTKYYPYADRLTEVQSTLVRWMKDGKFDENEKEELAKGLEPIIDKIRKEIGL